MSDCLSLFAAAASFALAMVVQEPPAEEQPSPAAQPPPPQVQEPPPAGYRTPDEVLAKVAELARPPSVAVCAVAETPEGRAVLLASFGEVAAPGRPAVLVVADPAGDRPAATALALGLCERLAADGSPLLERATVYVVPVANPDGAARSFRSGAPSRGRPVDDDRDGFCDEDPPEDLDGDGFVLQMRVPDPAGAWLADPGDPRAMRKAERDRGEAGGFRLLREGRDDDGDREWNEDGPGGILLEANWPHRYRPHRPESGPFQLSEPEARGLAEFVLRHPHLALVVVLGPEDNLAKVPEGRERPDAAATDPLRADVPLLRHFGERLHKGQEHKPRSPPHGHGNFADWAYQQMGHLVLESAVWSPPSEAEPRQAESPRGGEGAAPGAAAAEETPREAGQPPGPAGGWRGARERQAARRPAAEVEGPPQEEVTLLRWNDRVLGGEGFVAWHPFAHPELGEVEIGGWKPFVLQNPPASEIPALLERWSAFLDALAGDFAALRWVKLDVKPLGNGVHDARATLVNEGFLPTATEMSRQVRRSLPVRVFLELPEGGALLAGQRIQAADRLDGLGGSEEFRWVFRLAEGSPPAQVRATSLTAGEALATLEVKE